MPKYSQELQRFQKQKDNIAIKNFIMKSKKWINSAFLKINSYTKIIVAQVALSRLFKQFVLVANKIINYLHFSVNE